MTGFALDRECPYCGGTVAPDLAWCTHCANELPVASPRPDSGTTEVTADADAAVPVESEGAPGES